MPYYIGDVIRNPEKLIVRAPGEFRKSGIEVRLNSRVEELDIKGGRVLLSGGDVHPFDKLVIATGAEPLLPGVPGQDLEGVFRLRTLH
ncbi:MAG: FAD-dependent oxidoreductase, partial [Syntrophales bacterium]|nr:FAD-dependent oxidoreductase [Syntrophales bacterium]